jgi:hypothetical protein
MSASDLRCIMQTTRIVPVSWAGAARDAAVILSSQLPLTLQARCFVIGPASTWRLMTLVLSRKCGGGHGDTGCASCRRLFPAPLCGCAAISSSGGAKHPNGSKRCRARGLQGSYGGDQARGDILWMSTGFRLLPLLELHYHVNSGGKWSRLSPARAIALESCTKTSKRWPPRPSCRRR